MSIPNEQQVVQPNSREMRAQAQPRRVKAVHGMHVPAAPTFAGTLVLILGLIMAWGSASGYTVSQMLFLPSVIVGASVTASFVFDAQLGLRNLARTDVLMLIAIYGLLFMEFLFPQPDADHLIDVHMMRKGFEASLLAMGSFAVGRHLVNPSHATSSRFFRQPVSPTMIPLLFAFCFFAGYLHQWIAVSFDPVKWIDAMAGRRWSQPWARGKYGGWKELLVEVGALLYLLPPIGGILIARAQRYGLLTRLFVVAAVFITLYEIFASGSRNAFIVSVMMFVVAYGYFSQMKPQSFLALLMAVFVAMFFLSKMMLAFRNTGLKEYIQMRKAGYYYEQEVKSVFVDYNMVSLSNLMRVVPARHPYLGWRVFYYTLIRPIPRAIWKNKPDAGGAEINDALMEKGMNLTFSVSYVGEAWMIQGWISVIGVSLLFGALGCWWNRFGTAQSSDLGIIIYASGLLSAVISMRSFMGVVVTLLPTLFLLVSASWFLTEVAPVVVRRIVSGNRGSRVR